MTLKIGDKVLVFNLPLTNKHYLGIKNRNAWVHHQVEYRIQGMQRGCFAIVQDVTINGWIYVMVYYKKNVLGTFSIRNNPRNIIPANTPSRDTTLHVLSFVGEYLMLNDNGDQDLLVAGKILYKSFDSLMKSNQLMHRTKQLCEQAAKDVIVKVETLGYSNVATDKAIKRLETLEKAHSTILVKQETAQKEYYISEDKFFNVGSIENGIYKYMDVAYYLRQV